ncbi:cytochrome P450 [Phenylobacterium montanum]|uniref:Cytochrome P450 n=1 Tax=Phenylobacterium montanum TaxID=2823693 RepID=A0A975G159_9CAUL|nr:cytochrome P450 [Caulobacter sp. S6]QUD88643.1 cytochrome P450 [Caulobacter sp. S6]
MTYPFSYSTDLRPDLSSQDLFNEGAPFAAFARMRAEEPLAWTPEQNGRGFWSLTRHEDILTLNRKPELLSSARGIRMEDQTPEEFEARKTFQETDPPVHTAFRSVVNHAFSRKAVAAYEGRISELVGEILDSALTEGEFDGVEMIARRLPMLMLAQIMGVPREDAQFLVERGDALISNADPDYTDFVVDKVDTDAYRLLPFRSPAAIELFDYANDLLDRMDRGESLGVLSLVHQAMAETNLVSRDEFRNFFCLLVAAGNDTTRYSIAAALHALANDPALLAQIQSPDFQDWDAAALEMIRWASPTSYFRRTATADFDLHGKTVRRGDKVILWFLSANRDGEGVSDPDRIDLTRSPNPNLAFGQGGPHVCLGMWLARLEVRIVLQQMARRVRAVEQTSRHAYLRSNFIHGIKKLPLRMAAR